MAGIFRVSALLGVVLLLGVGCGERTRVGIPETLDWSRHLKLPAAGFAPATQLEIITWYDYIPQDVYDFFTKTYGTRIVPTLIGSNEEMLQLLQENPDRYDLLTPSDYMVSVMIEQGRLHPLEHKRLPNMAGLDEDVRRLEYDPGLRYSVPLFRASLGLAFNIRYIEGIPRDWDFLLQQIRNDYLAHRVGTTREMRYAMGLALVMRGYSANSTDPQEIKEAREALIELVESYGFNLMVEEESGRELVNEDILLGLVWSGTAAAALRDNSNIRFLLPEGKILVSIDSAVINNRSRQIATAELFANYLLTPQVAARLSNYSDYRNCIHESFSFVDKVVRNGPGFFFPDPAERLFLRDVGEEAADLYGEAWEEVLQARPRKDLVKLPLPAGGFFVGGATMSPDFALETPGVLARDQVNINSYGPQEGL